MITFTFNKTDVKVVNELQLKSSLLADALTDRMTYLMTKLQQKIQNKTIGRVRESVRNPRAEVEGGKVVGKLDWGGDISSSVYKGGRKYDFAQILNQGAKAHAINPLGLSGQLGGVREHVRGGLPKRIGKNVLRFYSDRLGKPSYAAYVFHPGIEAQHFIEKSVDEMKQEFKKGIQEALNDFLDRKR